MASIRKRELPSGKSVWQVDYRDGAGARRHRQFPTKREADSFMVRARAEVAAGTHVADSASATVAEAAEAWLRSCERADREKSTLRYYRQHVDLHILPFIGKQRLTAIRTPTVFALRDQLQDAGRSPEMVRRVVQSLGRVFKYAQGRGLVGQNPVEAAQVPPGKRGKERVVIPSREDLRALLAGAGGRLRPLIVTAIFTGLRASELRGLAWRDVDLDKRTLHVRQRADAWGRIGPPKTAAGRRDVPLAPYVVNALREWHLECPNGALGLVFPNGAGNVESLTNIDKRGWKPLQEEALGAVRYNFHGLRHAAASMFIEQGFGPKRIQAVLGHSSITTTFDRYGHLFRDEAGDQEAMKAIEARLLG